MEKFEDKRRKKRIKEMRRSGSKESWDRRKGDEDSFIIVIYEKKKVATI